MLSAVMCIALGSLVIRFVIIMLPHASAWTCEGIPAALPSLDTGSE